MDYTLTFKTFSFSWAKYLCHIKYAAQSLHNYLIKIKINNVNKKMSAAQNNCSRQEIIKY